MFHKLKIIILVLFVLLSLTAQSEIKDPNYDELEGIHLVEALIRDGKLEQARQELKDLPKTNDYWLTSGNLNLAAEKFKEAKASYELASRNPDRQLRLARAHFGLKDFLTSARFYRDSDNLWLNQESDIIKKATAEFSSGSLGEAWTTLVSGNKKSPSFALKREQVAFLLEMNLVQLAIQTSLANYDKLTSAQILALAELFNNKKLVDESITLVELARTLYPFDLDVNLSFAQVYFQKNQLRTTVEGFERASKVDAKYSYHTSEMRRQLGQTEQALYLSQFITTEKERLKSRMALYVDQANYPMIASLESVISRSELKNDDEIRYALAYSLARQGALDRTLTHLNRIQKTELLEKTAMLKKAVLECKAGTGSCRL